MSQSRTSSRPGLALVLAGASVLAGCGERDEIWDAHIDGNVVTRGLTNAAAIIDPPANRALLLPVNGDQKLEPVSLPIGEAFAAAETTVDGSHLLALSLGDVPRRTSEDEGPSLTVIADTPEPSVKHRYELSDPLSGLAIDPEQPQRTLEGSVTIRNLKDPGEAGANGRVDLALQGPSALPTLERAVDDPGLYRAIAHLKPFEFCEGHLDGVDAIISRTGYTGAPVGFELYVHPDRAPEVWRRLLEVGAPFGVQPAGLAARDSTRTEAGLPLHGHELAGPYNVSPIEAGYGGFVKLHKPVFIGRAACVDQARSRTRSIVAFQLEDRGGRVPRTGAVVVDAARGRYAGVVTSVAGYDERQFGLALVEYRHAEPDTRLAIFPAAATPKTPAKWPAELGPGDQIPLARSAVVLPRFPLSRRAPAAEEEAE